MAFCCCCCLVVSNSWVCWLRFPPCFKRQTTTGEDVCLAGWGFTNFYKQLKMEALRGRVIQLSEAALSSKESLQAGRCSLRPPLCQVVHLLLHPPCWQPMELSSSSVSQNRVSEAKNEAISSKSLVQNIPVSSLPGSQASCHLAPFGATPQSLPGAALAHRRWARRAKKNNSKQKAPNPSVFSPNKIPADKNITCTLLVSYLPHFAGVLASWTCA